MQVVKIGELTAFASEDSYVKIITKRNFIVKVIENGT